WVRTAPSTTLRTTTDGGSSPTVGTWIVSTAIGTTSWTGTIVPPAPSGRANRMSTTPTRPHFCPRPSWPPPSRADACRPRTPREGTHEHTEVPARRGRGERHGSTADPARG